MPETRTCKTCGKTLSLGPENFFKGKGYKGGFVPSCKPCHSARQSFLNKQNGTEAKRYKRDKAKRDAHVRAWVEKNKARQFMNQKLWREENQDRKFNNHLGYEYGVTREQYDAMYVSQGGVCAICGALPYHDKRQKKLNVDHDHATGHVRGLLCGRCNRAIGLMLDDQDRLLNASNYIAAHKAKESANVISIERNVK